jgi:phosphoglycolate phosphatase
MTKRLPGCILFDLDGTLLDSLPGIEYSVKQAFVSCGLPEPQRSLRRLIGPPIRTIIAEVGGVRDPYILEKLEEAFRKSYDCDGSLRTGCYPDAKRILLMLRARRYRTFIVSNKPRHISERILKTEGITNLFEAIITRDSRSPSYSGKAEMIMTLINERNIDSDDCLFAGDTMEDAVAARETGVKFAYLTHGYGDISDEISASFEYMLDSFQEFERLMAKELVND